MLQLPRIDLSFPWAVSDAGYEWRRGEGLKVLLCEKNVAHARKWVYQPLLQYPALFREVATLEGRDQIRRFADNYGLIFDQFELTDHVRDRGQYYSIGAAFGTSLTVWAQEIADIGFLIELWDSIEAGRINALRKLISWKAGEAASYQLTTPKRSMWKLLSPTEVGHPFKEGEVLNPARHALQHEINDRLSGDRSAGISYAPRLLRRADGKLRLMLRPRNLLSAIWLQFAQVVGHSYELTRCPSCERYFLPKRNDAITCSDACRQRKKRGLAANKVFRRRPVRNLVD
jgi:hypothetical protein